MNKLQELLANYQGRLDELKSLAEKGDEMTAEDVTAAEALKAELSDIRGQIEEEKSKQAVIAQTKAFDQWMNDPANAIPVSGDGSGENGENKTAVVTVRNRPSGNTKAARIFKAQGGVSSQKRAYGFGMWALATLCRNQKGIEYCKANGIEMKTMIEGDNNLGGALVPTEYENDIIDLREQYGTFRRLARQRRMTSDTLLVPRRVSGLTAYPVGEGAAGTASTKKVDLIELVARKWMVLTSISSELNEDSVIDLATDLADESAYAFAFAEDDAGFNGDGTSAYHGIVGVRARMKNLSATIAYIAGLIVASGNAYDEILLNDLIKVKGKLPKYARTPRTRWFCHQTFFSDVMERVMLASGGVTAAEVAAGRLEDSFLGYPVEINQTLPSVEANSQVPLLFGELSLSTDFGDRRGVTMAMADQFSFNQDLIDIRGTERFDINVHDVGNFHATAGSRVAGPVVGLIMAAS